MATAVAPREQGYLSEQTLAKQAAVHPEVRSADYRLLPELIDYGKVSLQGDERILPLYEADYVLRAALKATKDGQGIYLVSLFRTRREAAERAVAGLEELQ